MIEQQQLQKIIEAALFAAESPLKLDYLQQLFEEDECPQLTEIQEALSQLREFYLGRGIELVEVASGYRFQVVVGLDKWITKLWEERPQKYSRATLETLALIAYRQPITRAEIEEVRGVAVNTQIIKSLQEREWIREVGHKDVPGKPALLATTKQFLDYFNLKSLNDLPTLAEIQDLERFTEQLENSMQETNHCLQLELPLEDDLPLLAEEITVLEEDNEPLPAEEVIILEENDMPVPAEEINAQELEEVE